MDVAPMMRVFLRVTDAVIRKPTLPYFPRSKCQTEGAGISAFDELKRSLERSVWSRRDQQMHVLRHENKPVEFEATFAVVCVKSLQKEPCILFDHKEAAALPGRKGNEICP